MGSDPLFQGEDLDSLGIGAIHGGYLLNSVIIILIDILLSGDNAVVLALAVHALPRNRRIHGILAGAAGAVVFRTLLTWFASNLIQTPFLKLVGGLIVLWIAIRLLIEEAETGVLADMKGDMKGAKQASTFWRAVWMILAADFTMSPDNVLAGAGAAKGSMSILWLSLGVSIPLVFFSGNALSGLMNRFPLLVLAGAALLGKVGGEMIFTDPAIIGWLHLEESKAIRYGFQALCAAAVPGVAYRLKRKHRDAAPATEPPEAERPAP